jgi:hypothetical protein
MLARGIRQKDRRPGLDDVGSGQDILAGKVPPEKPQIVLPEFVFQRLQFFFGELIDQNQQEFFCGHESEETFNSLLGIIVPAAEDDVPFRCDGFQPFLSDFFPQHGTTVAVTRKQDQPGRKR